MGRIVLTRFPVLPIPAFVLSVLLPTVALAGWGDENRGEMIWGAAAPQIPAMLIAGVAALAALLPGLPPGCSRSGTGAASARRCAPDDPKIWR